MNTKFARKEDFYNGTHPRAWWIVDAEGRTLGRLATQIAHVLRGKHKTLFSPHVDTGDFVIVVNAEKIHVSGKKMRIKCTIIILDILEELRAPDIMNCRKNIQSALWKVLSKV